MTELSEGLIRPVSVATRGLAVEIQRLSQRTARTPACGWLLSADGQMERAACSQNGARSLRLKIFPESSRGRASANSMRRGTL